MLSSPRRPSSTIRIFSSAEYFLRVCSVYLSPSFLLFVLSSSLPLGVNDELKLSLTQLAYLVHIVLTGTVPNGVGNVIPQETKDALQPILTQSWQAA
jgi:hypothetical protein